MVWKYKNSINRGIQYGGSGNHFFVKSKGTHKSKLPKWIVLFMVIVVAFFVLQLWRAKEKTEQKYMVDSVVFHEMDYFGKEIVSNMVPALTFDESSNQSGTKEVKQVMEWIVPCLFFENMYGQDEVALCEQALPKEYMENGGVDESSNATVETIGIVGHEGATGESGLNADGGNGPNVASGNGTSAVGENGPNVGGDNGTNGTGDVLTKSADENSTSPSNAGADVITSDGTSGGSQVKKITSAKRKKTKKGEKKHTPTPNHTYSSVYTDQQLLSFSFLKSTLYVPDAITPIKENDLNVKKLMGVDLSLASLKKDAASDSVERQLPLVLIYHTHTSEAFADSKKGHVEDTVVGVGDVLAEELMKNGIPVLHDKTVYDVINGKLDRSAAYNVAGESVQKILKQNPSIEVVIDLHRDGVAEGTRLVTTVNGKKMAQIMLFNGMSRIKDKGEISYLANPHRTGNLAFTLQLQLKGLDQYDGLMRKIFLRSYRYNLHFKDRSLLVEAGAQTNKVQEVKNSMVPLGDMISQVLLGE